MALSAGQIISALAPIVGKVGAAGVAGNTMQESTNNPGSAGGGLAQWQGARYTGLVNYAHGHGLDPSSGQAALGYLAQDLSGPYKGLANQLRAAKTPQQAADLFSNIYERPGTPMLGNRERYAAQALGAPVPKLGKAPAPTAVGVPTSSTTSIGPKTDMNSAIIDSLLKPVPIKADGSIPSGTGLLNSIVNNIDSGRYTTPAQTVTTNGLTGKLSPLGGKQPGTHDLNPLPGWTIGRTDMGVDANAPKVGAPVLAMNDSKVVRILPGWYKGQPLVELQLTAGPNKGKMWYVAEQITGVPKVGTVIARGQKVVSYAPSGTGIEIGWGAPGGQTEAQATTGYTEGQVTKAGSNFKSTFGLK
jgi:hypothetical protein